MTDKNKDELLKFFVYVLIDPRNYEIFYVGKGQGFRNFDHKPGEEKQKGIKIKEIEKTGFKLITRIIGRYETEKEAFSVESTLIKWVYGKENLTNEVFGHGHSLIRPHSHLRDKNFIDLPGIDQERQLYVHTGEYTKIYKNQIRDNKILTKLNDLKEDLLHFYPTINISEPIILTPMDPCLLIPIPIFSKILQIQIRMPPKSGTYFTINFIPVSSKVKKEFEKLILKKFPEEKVRNGNAFGKYLPYYLDKKLLKIYLNDKKKIIDLLPNLISLF
tara:strand:+ start:24 stop:845 length:822 start_codon:yes stop_codon:yes gene_type:complete